MMKKIDQIKNSNAAFSKWKKTFDVYLSEMIDELKTDFLDKLGIKININQDYVFNGGKSKWLASYEGRSRKILDGIISIGINYPLMYSEMCKRHIDKDEFNIEAQARITIGHEVGHGLVDYIKNLKYDNSMSEMPNVLVIRKCNANKEEEIVEEFGEYQFPDATSCWDSVLCDALGELSSYTDIYRNGKIDECDCCAPNGGITLSDVAGMGDIYFPSNGHSGSGDLPLPSGKLYTQVMPFHTFVKIPKSKKKKKRKLEKHSDGEHSPNPPIYKYVDDFRTYVQRTFPDVQKTT